MADTIYLHDPDRVAGSVTLDDPAVQGGGGGPGAQTVDPGLIDQSGVVFAPTIPFQKYDDFNHALSGYDGTLGTPAIVSSPVRSGSGALEISAVAEEYVAYNVPAGNRKVTQSVYIRFNTLPGADAGILSFIATSQGFLMYLTATQQFGVRLGGVNVAGGPTLTTGVWYLVDVEYDSSAATGVIKAKVNGGTEFSRSAAITAADITAVRLGSTGATFTGYYEDWAITAADGVYPIGQHGFTEVRPGLIDQSGVVFTPETVSEGGAAPQSVTPALLDQSGVVFNPADFEQQVLGALIDQSGVTFAPQFNLKVSLGLIDQSGVTFSPQIDLRIFLGLIDQAGITFTPQVNLRTTHNVIDQAGTTFAPTINLGASIGIIDQAGVIFSPVIDDGTGVQTVDPGLIDQSGVTFSPQVNMSISMSLINQTGTVFSPQVNMNVSMGLIDQSGVVFAPARLWVSRVYLSLIDQSGTLFAPTVEGGEEPEPVLVNLIKKMRRYLTHGRG